MFVCQAMQEAVEGNDQAAFESISATLDAYDEVTAHLPCSLMLPWRSLMFGTHCCEKTSCLFQCSGRSTKNRSTICSCRPVEKFCCSRAGQPRRSCWRDEAPPAIVQHYNTSEPPNEIKSDFLVKFGQQWNGRPRTQPRVSFSRHQRRQTCRLPRPR